VLRWLELAGLDGLEELVCRSPLLQRFVLLAHERALAKLLSMIPRPRRVVIVGGGLFPRTALALRRLVPEATLTLVDAREDRLERANGWLNNEVECVSAFCTAANLPQLTNEADLVVVPLALRGRRIEFYQNPPARNVLIHDWLWHPRGQSVVVSWLLLKRLNLVSSSHLVGTARCAVRAAFSGATVPPAARAGTSQRDVPTKGRFVGRVN